MENVAGGQLFPYKSSYSFKDSDCHKFSFFNDGSLKLGHFGIFDMLFPFPIAHNFMKNRSHHGLAAKGLLATVQRKIQCLFC